MNIASIIATFVAVILIITGIENNTEGPIWLGFLVLALVFALRLYVAFEDYMISKITDW